MAQQQCQEREHLPDLGKALADNFVGGRSLLYFVTRTVLHKYRKSAIVDLRGVKTLAFRLLLRDSCSFRHPAARLKMPPERPTYELLEHFEHCHREGIYARDWQKSKITPAQMLAEGIKEGLTVDSPNYGQMAGEHCFELAVNPGLDSKEYDLHSETIHICSLSDVISSAIRKKEPWKPLGAIEVGEGGRWENDAYLDDTGCLRRVLCVSSWSDERHYGLCRSWGTLGTMCLAGRPMKIAVAVLGQHKDGRYHGPWSKGLLHPANKKLRFRKKTEGKFKDTYIPVWREDRAEISTNEWLDSMLTDGVLQDSLILIDIPLPSHEVQKEIRDLAARKLKTIYATRDLPEKQYSTCFWPVPCIFKNPCHSDQAVSGRFGFVRLDSIG